MEISLTPVSVTVTTYNASADVEFGFEADSILVVNRTLTTGDEVRFSFNGMDDHGEVVAGLIPAMEYKAKRRRIWLRRTSAGTTTIHVMANTVI